VPNAFGPHHLVEVRGGRLENRSPHDGSGGIDEDVQSTELPITLSTARCVESESVTSSGTDMTSAPRLATTLRCLEPFWIACRQRHSGPGSGQRARGRGT